MDWAIATARQDEKHSDFGIWCNLYKRFYGSLVGCSVLMRHTGITCVLRLGNHGVPWCGRWMEFTNGHRFCHYFDVYVININDNFNCKILLTDARPEIIVRCVIKVLSVDTILTCIFSCDQAALQMVFSVRPSVCLSVRLSVTPFSPCSHHRIIMKFSGVITIVKSDVHAKGQGQRSKVKVTEVNTQLSRFRTLTPVWIHIWQWNHAHSWKQHRRGALLFFKVIRQISRSHGSKNGGIWPRLAVSGL